jgi:hypothetical protein
MKTYSSTVISQFLVVKEHGQLPESASIMLSPVYLLLHKIAIFAFLSNLAEGWTEFGPTKDGKSARMLGFGVRHPGKAAPEADSSLDTW